MKKFTTFYFEDFYFDLKEMKAHFRYSFDHDVYFEELIDFSIGQKLRSNIDKEILDNLLFQLHLVLGMSYYKLFPTQELVVQSGFLDQVASDFWNKLYLNGLGEFFITNNISPK